MLNPIAWRAVPTQRFVSRATHVDRWNFITAVDRVYGRAKAENITGNQGLHVGDDRLGPVQTGACGKGDD